jgi:hypothetical protein
MLRMVALTALAGLPALAFASLPVDPPAELPTPSVLALMAAGGAAAGYVTYRNRKK